MNIPNELILRLRVAMQDMGTVAGKRASQVHIVAPMMEFFDLTDGLLHSLMDTGKMEWDKEGQK